MEGYILVTDEFKDSAIKNTKVILTFFPNKEGKFVDMYVSAEDFKLLKSNKFG